MRDPARSRRGVVGLLVATTVALLAPGAGPAAASSPTAVAPSAPSSSNGACTDPSGVTVVVDFGAFGGGVEVRCAGWPVADGYDALRKAGYAVTDTTRFPGLLCRIDGLPGDQACVAAPPADAHWGYSSATRGGSWTYSSQGARARTVKAGDVEGWAFGKAARPSIAPPAPAPTTTTAPPPTAPPTTAAPAPAAPAPPPTAGSPSSVEEPPSTTTETVEAEPEASTSTSAAPEAGTERNPSDRLAAGPEDTRLAAPRRPPESGSGTPVPAIATVAAVAALVGGGVVLRRRRGVEA